MKLNELEGIQWFWDEEEQDAKLDETKRIRVTLRDAYFVEKISVLAGYANADDAVGKLFFSKKDFMGGTSPYFVILPSGRIWFLNKHEIPKEQFAEVIRKILVNPDIVKVLNNVTLIKTAADLVLS